MKKLYFILSGIFASCLVSDIYAQDLRPMQIQQVSVSEFSTGQPIVSAGNTLFFEVYAPGGSTLWTSDGTGTGTSIIKQINPVCKNCGSGYTEVYKDEVYFSHNDTLWKSDGTNTKVVAPNTILLYPQLLTKSNGLLFFRAYDTGAGYELWKTDGKAVGTTMVKDINTSSTSEPLELTDVNNTLFFTANDGDGYALWKSDGTETGTVLVKDVPAWQLSPPKDFINVNGTLYFLADDGTSGFELWKSDGTTQGTVLVKDIKAGEESSNIREMVNVNGTLYFITYAGTGADGALWKSDGTAAGTVMVKDLYAAEMMLPKLLNVNGELFIATSWMDKWHLSKLNAATAEIIKLREVTKNPDIVNFVNPAELINYEGVAYFSATDSVKGYEIWRSDGTVNGTFPISDYAIDQPIYGFTQAKNQLYFYVNDSSNTLSLNTLVETFGFDEAQVRNAGISVYPNPAATEINIVLTANVNHAIQLAFYDASGRKVLSKENVKSGEKLETRGLPNGLYILLVKSGNEIIQREKIIINK